MNERERTAVAYHSAVMLVAALVPHADPVAKSASCLRRSALGYHADATEDRYLLTQPELDPDRGDAWSGGGVHRLRTSAQERRRHPSGNNWRGAWSPSSA